MTGRPKKRKDDASAPSRATLHEAGLAYVARNAATAVTLRRALERKVTAWARRVSRTQDPEVVAKDVEVCHEAIDGIVARFREVGLVNDAAFAESRVRGLTRSGRSRRAIAAHLAAKGIDQDIVREALPRNADMELAAALTFARKRRVGPYAREATEDLDDRRRAIAAMARAGFDFRTCERALRMDREEADRRIADARS
jgi:regulatory protein